MTTPVEFRQARRDEVPQIVALLADDDLGRGREGRDISVYLDAYDAISREAGNRVYVGVMDGSVVATYQLTIISGLSRSATRRAQIEGVRVASSLRGAGVGRALLADAERRAQDAGCSLIQLTSDRQRDAAQVFYEAAGYIPSHTGFKKPL